MSDRQPLTHAPQATPDTVPTRSFRAMGSQIALWLAAGAADAAAAFDRVEALFARRERRLSRFLADSELRRLNAAAGGWLAVTATLFAAVDEALLWAERTAGAFDPTLLEALVAAGYDRSFDRLGPALRRVAFEPVGRAGCWAEVRLDRERRRVWLPPGVGLDLGGIAKGQTARRARDLLAEVGPCLVDAGGDVTAGEAPPGLPGWAVAVGAPAASGETETDLDVIWLAGASAATSGVDYRAWTLDGKPAHHLIDPTTGRPARTDLASATVVAIDAVSADVLATVSVVGGSQAARRLARETGLPTLLVDAWGAIWTSDNWHRYRARAPWSQEA